MLFSGSTFVVALFGMLLVPTTIMRSLAAGAIVVGVVSVAAALTLLPALLALLGDRVNALRVPFVGRSLGRAERLEGRMWRAIVERVLARPAVILDRHGRAAARRRRADLRPAHRLKRRQHAPQQPALQAGLPRRAALLPGAEPVSGAGRRAGRRRRAVALLDDSSRSCAPTRSFGAGTIQVAASGDVAMLRLPVRGDSNSPAAVAAVRDLRTLARRELAPTGAIVHVGGHTAELADYYDAVTQPTPYVIPFVLGLSMIVLTIAFRSIVVALVSIALNLLSVGAAYGLLTLVFLKGVGASLFGFQHVAVVDAWVPLFLFSVLFGLSMDYQVFLMSRIKERYDQGATTRDAVASGIASTARIITGAALIIVVVFIGFARGQLVMFQQMGFSVAVALLIDATMIRSIVLPSMLALLGRRSWYLPHWLDWLPRVELDRTRSDARRCPARCRRFAAPRSGLRGPPRCARCAAGVAWGSGRR